MARSSTVTKAFVREMWPGNAGWGADPSSDLPDVQCQPSDWQQDAQWQPTLPRAEIFKPRPMSEEERKCHMDNQLCLNYGKRTVETPALVKTQQAATTSIDYFSEPYILTTIVKETVGYSVLESAVNAITELWNFCSTLGHKSVSSGMDP
ncbi:hypothetical protein V8E54_007869 [Elaphomyces granulatus]